MLEKRYSKRQITLALICLVTMCLFNVFHVEIARTIWIQWVGREIDLGDISLQIEAPFFLFPGHENGLVFVGRFETDDDLFPTRNQLVLRQVNATERNDGFEKLRNWCKTSPNCGDAKIAWEVAKRQDVSCYARSGRIKDWDDQEFHIMCSVGANGVVVEYHGSKAEHHLFGAQVTSIADALFFPKKIQRGE